MVGRSKRVLGSLVAAAACCLSTSLALAVSQPNGTVVPVLDANVATCSDKNVEVCLDAAEGDPASIDARMDALVAPETFPTCQLTFTPLVKGGKPLQGRADWLLVVSSGGTLGINPFESGSLVDSSRQAGASHFSQAGEFPCARATTWRRQAE
jgi:hypothetical protein